MNDSPPPASGPLHAVANHTQWPWLPKDGVGVLAPHPYCQDCGLVMFVGAARALDQGGLANLLRRLDRRLGEVGLRLTEAHRRLIQRRLSDVGADDPFGLGRRTQERLVSQAVGHYLQINPDTVESYLRSC